MGIIMSYYEEESTSTDGAMPDMPKLLPPVIPRATDSAAAEFLPSVIPRAPRFGITDVLPDSKPLPPVIHRIRPGGPRFTTSQYPTTARLE